ncbi:phosphatase PAP2 family protein [Thioclava sp. GXIMD4216]|uniref:phosphatase PAP2 family protein n=1 Tax=Thioclava sp. GXIMD4216 TaxID=3131929 RepID=UPI0030CFCAE5
MINQPLRSFSLSSGRRLRAKRVPLLVMGILALVIALSPPSPRRYGDHLQIALPVLALGCEIANGNGLEYLGRYVVLFAGIHGTKRTLGDIPLNTRPNGKPYGFPSGHTATATFGAASLVNSCLLSSPVAKGAVILAAAFTGASRIQSHNHDIWQVLAGAIWGIACNGLFRRESFMRRVLRRGAKAAGRAARRGMRPVLAVGAWLPAQVFALRRAKPLRTRKGV